MCDGKEGCKVDKRWPSLGWVVETAVWKCSSTYVSTVEEGYHTGFRLGSRTTGRIVWRGDKSD